MMIFKKTSKLNPVVEDDEPLGRYIFSKNHYSKENQRVKRQAFMPPENGKKLSVMRHKNCSEDCILKIGKQLEKERKQSLKALCSILTKDARSLDLDVVSDTGNNQHRRHANIINFPEAKMRELANELANIATRNKNLLVLENT